MTTISEKGEITLTFDSSLSEKVTVAAAKADTTIPRYIVDAIVAAIERSRVAAGRVAAGGNGRQTC